MRIVSLCPSNTEILFALGLGPKVVGVDDWSDWPEEVKDLPRVGGDLNADMERVAALRPDLVLASLSVPGMERNVDALKAHDLPYLVLDPRSLDEVLADFLTVGDACGVRGRAEKVLEDAHRRIDAVRRRRTARRQVRIYWEWWPKPLIAAGRSSWVNQMSQIAGARNVFADIDEPSRKVTDAEVIDRDPEVLMVCWCGTLQRIQDASKVASRPGWERISGVFRGRVHCVPEALFGRPSQRLLEGLEMLEGLIAQVT